MGSQDRVATFESFVRRSAGGYRDLARSYLHDLHEAEDVVQSAFLKTWRAWSDMREDPGLEAWVARIIRNECIDRWRRNETARRHEARVARERRESEPPPGASTLDGLEEDGVRTSDLDRVRGIIRELPDPYRSVLLLRFVERLPYGEIARVLDRPLGTVKTQICRAVRLVRIQLCGS